MIEACSGIVHGIGHPSGTVDLLPFIVPLIAMLARIEAQTNTWIENRWISNNVAFYINIVNGIHFAMAKASFCRFPSNSLKYFSILHLYSTSMFPICCLLRLLFVFIINKMRCIDEIISIQVSY